MKNVLTVDLEDWHQLAYRRVTGVLRPGVDGVQRQLDVLLDLLREHGTKSTFFVLGIFAERYPELVRRISSEGHEIASHGYAHLIVNSISRREFEEDAQRSKVLLEDVCGQSVLGYRAAEFSIRRPSLWALEVLAELGFAYDSSIFPIHHRRYGISGFEPGARRYRLPNGAAMVEIPPATVAFGRFRFPVAGGGYFRLLPAGWLKRAFRRLNEEGAPVVTYFHPYELDSKRLNLFAAGSPSNVKQLLRGWQFNLHQNLRRRSVPHKLTQVLRSFSFTTCQEFLRETAVPDSTALLPG